MLDFGLAGKVIAITGGASGIGRAVAEVAVRHGAAVAVIDLDESSVERTVAALESGGGTAAGFAVDVRDRPALASAIDESERILGPLHGAVACAGISRPVPSEDATAEQWSAVIDINLTGAFNTAQAVAERMLPRGEGSIVVIGSTDSLGGHAHRASYAASKHGVLGLVRSLSIDWGRSGIRVNVVAPGAVDTPLLRSIHDQTSINTNFLVRVPLGRMSSPEDQAHACLFLMSDAASYITGAVLPVDGGLTAGYFNNQPVSD